MTIDKAIEINKDTRAVHLLHREMFAVEAIQLGIEALKLYKSCGHPTRCGMLTRLPGETRE